MPINTPDPNIHSTFPTMTYPICLPKRSKVHTPLPPPNMPHNTYICMPPNTPPNMVAIHPHSAQDLPQHKKLKIYLFNFHSNFKHVALS